jgi:hypothetical protein
MDMERLAEIFEAVKVMPLRPDDVIVVRTSVRVVSVELRDWIVTTLKPIFGDHKTLVLENGSEIEIVRPELVAAPDPEDSRRLDHLQTLVTYTGPVAGFVADARVQVSRLETALIDHDGDLRTAIDQLRLRAGEIDEMPQERVS